MKEEVHKIKTQRMELTFDNESKAHALHQVISDLCHHDVKHAIENCLQAFSSPDEIIYFKTLELDLGAIDYTELRMQLPAKVSEALQKILSGVFSGTRRTEVEVKSFQDAGMESVAAFLQHGFMPWNAQKQDLVTLLQHCLQHKGNELARFIRATGTSHTVRVRLTERFSAPLLQKIVKVLEPQHGQLIIDYHGHLVRLNDRETIVKTPQSVLEKTLWLFVFNHLLLEQGSVFNTRSFARSLLHQFSCHFNIAFHELVSLITSGLRRWEGSIPPPFFTLLEEISTTFTSLTRHGHGVNHDDDRSRALPALSVFLQHPGEYDFPATGDNATVKPSVATLLRRALKNEPHRFVAALKKMKNKPDVIRRIVTRAGSELPGEMIKAIEPGESEAIIDYHKNFIALHTIDPIAHASQRDLEHNLWTFMITNLLDNHGSYFNQKAFLKTLITVTASHYNIQEQALLHKLSLSAKRLPSRVSRINSFFRIVKEIYQEVQAVVPVTVTAAYDKESAKTQRLVSRAEQLLLNWKTGQGSTEQKPEQFILRFLASSPAHAIPVLKKYMHQKEVLNHLVAFTGFGFAALIARIAPSRASAWMQQSVVLFDRMMPELLPCFSSKSHYRRAVRTALLEIIAVIDHAVSMSDQDLLRLLLDKIAAKSNTLNGEQVLVYALKHPKDPLIPLLKTLVRDDHSRRRRSTADHPVLDDIVHWLLSSPGAARENAAVGFTSFNEALQFMVTYYPAELMRALAKHPVKQLQWFASRCTDADVSRMLLSGAGSHRADWCFRLLQEWSNVLSGFPGRTKLLLELKRVMLVGRIDNVVPVSDSFSGQLLRVLTRHKVPDSFFDALHPWELPAQGDVSGAIRKIERHVLRSEGRLPDAKKSAVRKSMIKEAVRKAEKKTQHDNIPLKEETEEESICLANAGLVLIHPYLTYLFEQCLLLEKGKFKTPDAAMRAVTMLHYAASGKEVFREEDHVLNKLLCGLDIGCVSKRVRLKRSEKEMVSGMLKALAEHWPAIRNSDADDVRGNWLVRDGRLRETEEYWELTVERKAYDVLLSSLPFTLSPVTFPWMKKMIMVHWL